MSAYRALSVAILKGFVRDRTALFFALVFPLMFLVLFGGLFGSQGQSKVDLIQVGPVPLVDDLTGGAEAAFEDTFDVERSDDLADALEQVRKGDADVVLEQDGDQVVAHYSRADQVGAAITQGTLQAFVSGANVDSLARAAGEPPPYALRTESVEDESLDSIQYYTPGLLGWAVALSATIGAAATIQGWRQTKLIRRLQLAPVSTRTVVAARISVTLAIALVQLAVFVGVAVLGFGPRLTGSWWMSVPLLLLGTLCFMSLGLLAGAVTKTTEGAVNAANFIVMPMSFLSGSFFPLEATPGWLQAISQALPLKHLNDAMLDVMVRGEGPGAVLLPALFLAVFTVVVTLVAARLFRWET